LLVSLLALVSLAPAALAKRVHCRDVGAALAAGKTPAEVETELGATRTRIEACQRIAADRAVHDARRAAHRQRRAEKIERAQQ
jgi:hypothetical protein